MYDLILIFNLTVQCIIKSVFWTISGQYQLKLCTTLKTLLISCVNIMKNNFCLFLFVCDDFIGGDKENFHHRVTEHKDIKKLVFILKSAVSSQRGQVTDILKQFNPFRVIWDENRNLKVKV